VCVFVYIEEDVTSLLGSVVVSQMAMNESGNNCRNCSEWIGYIISEGFVWNKTCWKYVYNL